MFTMQNRVIAIGIIWGVFGILSALTLITQGVSTNFLLIGIFAGAAWMATDSVSNMKDDTTSASSETGKAKRDSGSELNTLLALLDPDDLAELRYRVRERLMERIERGTDGELSALDQLIVDEEARQKRR